MLRRSTGPPLLPGLALRTAWPASTVLTLDEVCMKGLAYYLTLVRATGTAVVVESVKELQRARPHAQLLGAALAGRPCQWPGRGRRSLGPSHRPALLVGAARSPGMDAGSRLHAPGMVGGLSGLAPRLGAGGRGAVLPRDWLRSRLRPAGPGAPAPPRPRAHPPARPRAVSLLEPAVATMLALLVLHERLAVVAWSGLAAIAVSLLILTLPQPKRGGNPSAFGRPAGASRQGEAAPAAITTNRP